MWRSSWGCPPCLLRQGVLLGPEAYWVSVPASPGLGLQTHTPLMWVLGVKLRVSCLYGKQFSDWATSPDFFLLLFLSYQRSREILRLEIVDSSKLQNESRTLK